MPTHPNTMFSGYILRYSEMVTFIPPGLFANVFLIAFVMHSNKRGNTMHHGFAALP
jgi:hypothetical protein